MNYRKGFALPLLLIIIAALIVGGGAYMDSKQSNQTLIASSTTQASSSVQTTNSQTTPTKQSPSNPTGEWRPTSTLSRAYNINGWTWYWVDGSGQIRCMDRIVPTADQETFVASTYGAYAKDKNSVYRCDHVIPLADTNSFVTLDNTYARDRSHVFYVGQVLTDADPTTFTIVHRPILYPGQEKNIASIGKDKSHVYDLGTELPGADPVTFVILPPDIQKDKNWIYKNGEVFGPAALIDPTYSKTLPANCQKTGFYQEVTPSLVPQLFSEDLSIVGYTGYSAVCIIVKKTGQSEYYDLDGTPRSLSKDGSKILYDVGQKGDAGSATETCDECGTYAIDRATGKEEKIQ